MRFLYFAASREAAEEALQTCTAVEPTIQSQLTMMSQLQSQQLQAMTPVKKHEQCCGSQ